jgi:hypothetical protein
MMVSLCPDLRELYVVFITEGAACATLQVMSNRVRLRLGAQSRLLSLVLVHVLLHVLKKAWAPLVHVASVWV